MPWGSLGRLGDPGAPAPCMWARAKGFLWADSVHPYKVTTQGFIKHSGQLGPKLELCSQRLACDQKEIAEKGE